MILKNFRYKKNEYFIFCIKKKKKKELYFVVYFVLHLTELKRKRIVYQNMMPPLIMRLIMRYFDSENILIQKTNL